MSSPYLKSGDKIALVCTGTPCESDLDAKLSARYLNEQCGVEVCYQKDTFMPMTAAERAQIFLEYLRDPEIKAIWSVRGGEGTADLIPYLTSHKRSIMSYPPKLLIGFSDFTPLLVYFRQQFEWPTLHGVGSRQLAKKMVSLETEQSTLHWLKNPGAEQTISGLQPLNIEANQPLNVEAEVIGGNLTLLGISVADLWQLQARDKIILLEEVNEEPYKVTRTLKYLTRIGFFEGAKAVILGGFDFPGKTALENQSIFYNTDKFLREFASRLPCPVFYTPHISHGKTNFPIPFYVKATLTGGVSGVLAFRR